MSVVCRRDEEVVQVVSSSLLPFVFRCLELRVKDLRPSKHLDKNYVEKRCQKKSEEQKNKNHLSMRLFHIAGLYSMFQPAHGRYRYVHKNHT